jgi:hypothetical protein
MLNGLSTSANGDKAWQGLPYRGPAFPYKEDDPIERQPQMRMQAHVRIFNLGDEEDRAAYEENAQKWADQTIQVSFEDRQYDPEEKTWTVLMRWFDLFYAAPEQMVREAREGKKHAK